MNINQLKKGFCDVFGCEPQRLYFAPGRVNLIGEHTDYNGGCVLPCALTMGTYAAASMRDDDIVRLYSENFPKDGIAELKIGDICSNSCRSWAQYPLGVVGSFMLGGSVPDKGLDIFYSGDLPRLSGLSSSASIDVLTAFILRDMFSFEVNDTALAKLCQTAENTFNGVSCGIMDQFAVTFGRRNNAVLLNTDKLEYEYLPLELGEASIVITASNRERALTDSKYNERRSQCEQALADIRKVRDVSYLGELTEAEFEEVKTVIKDGICLRRARHAVYESRRTLYAAQALRDGDIPRFGRLMVSSHISLRDDYEVTGRELDTLFNAALSVPGVIGTRMTGAGFGGCTVSIVKNDAIPMFKQIVGDIYTRETGLKADFYAATAGDGAKRIL